MTKRVVRFKKRQTPKSAYDRYPEDHELIFMTLSGKQLLYSFSFDEFLLNFLTHKMNLVKKKYCGIKIKKNTKYTLNCDQNIRNKKKVQLSKSHILNLYVALFL